MKKRNIPKEGVIIAAGLVLFVSVSFVLNLISGRVFSAADAERPVPGTEPVTESTQDEDDLTPQIERTELPTHNDVQEPDMAMPFSVDNPAVTSEISTDSLQTISSGLLLFFSDYNIPHTKSEVISSDIGSIQSFNYVLGDCLYTDVIVEMTGSTQHYSVNRTQNEEAYADLSAALTQQGIDLPSAPDLEVEPAEDVPDTVPDASQQTEHDAPVIVR